MSTITINYTPNITSSSLTSSPFICHRVCYRKQGVGSYCCIEDDTDSVAGTPKDIIITVSDVPCASVPDVNPLACTDTVYEGYIQACCETEGSLSGRVDFTAEFVADPPCVNKQICCTSIRGLEDSFLVITDPGSGYEDANSPLTVLVVRDVNDTETTDADVQATISGGVITVLTVNTAGSYNKIPLLVIPSPTTAGTTASATAVIPCVDNKWQGNCNTSPQEVESVTLLLGECASSCFPKDFPFVYSVNDLSGIPDTDNFSYTPGGCCDCTTCRNYTIVTGSVLPFVTICYTKCSTPGDNAELVCVENFYPGAGSFNINCVVPESIYCSNDAGAILSITDNGGCVLCS